MCPPGHTQPPHDQLGHSVFDLSDVGLNSVTDDCDYIPFSEVSDIVAGDNDFKVIQLNVHGLISKQSELTKLITSCLHDSKVDLIILCETWLTGDVCNLVSVPGYEFYGVNCTVKKGDGLIANELKFTPRQDLAVKDDNFENCFIEIFSKGRNIICGSIYRPPNTNIKVFQNKMNECMDKIKLEKHKDIIIGMDHNLDFIKSNIHSGTEKFIGSLQAKSLFPCITRPTRITKNSSTLIDNIIINERIRDRQKSCVILHDLSDHFPSLIILNELFAKKRAPKEIMSSCITDYKLSNLKEDLYSVDWKEVLIKVNVDESYCNFLNQLSDCIYTHIPMKKLTIQPSS